MKVDTRTVAREVVGQGDGEGSDEDSYVSRLKWGRYVAWCACRFRSLSG